MNLDETALAAWLRLTLIPGIGGQTQRKLLKAFGLPAEVFSRSAGELAEIIGMRATETLLASECAEQVASALAWAAGERQHIVTLADPEYPQSLLEIADPPVILYVRGHLDLLNRPGLAIVGSRHPTAQGEKDAERFGASLGDAGLVVVSGLALGIDAAAHRGALSVTGPTVAVIGTGCDRIYPARNQALAQAIDREGAIVSEFPLGTSAVAHNFPRRNRLISGLSRGVLVVEAAIESGSLITARLAGEQGREVFAIPGSIHSPQSKGCHQLIKQGAKLVESVADILEELRGLDGRDVSSAPEHHTPVTQQAASDDNPDHAHLLQMMGFDPIGLDELVARSGFAAEQITVMLLHLELDGKVSGLPGCRYQQLAGG